VVIFILPHRGAFYKTKRTGPEARAEEKGMEKEDVVKLVEFLDSEGLVLVGLSVKEKPTFAPTTWVIEVAKKDQ